MQPISKVLLGACAACAIAQGGGIAYAQNANPPAAPDPVQSTDPQPAPGAMTDPAPAVPNPDSSATVPPATDTTTDPSAPVATDSTATEPRIDMADASSDKFGYAWHEDGLRTGVGVSAILGGGVTGFTDKTMRSTTADVGALWDLRVTIGSHIPVALDLSYLGSATDIGGMPGQSATLIGTTAEAALRYNVLPHYDWNPYVFAGAGWQHYDVSRSSGAPALTGMADSDDLIEFPVGTGVAYRRSGFVADLRGTFRATTEENLVVTNPATNSNFAPMHTWEASAALGYEF